MRYIVTAIQERAAFVRYLKQHIPHLEIVEDRERDAMETFLRACVEANNEPVVHLEDDIILTRDFLPKLEAEITAHPHDLLQGFSRSKYDLDLGSRWKAGASFMSSLCSYLPEGVSSEIIAYQKSKEWLALKKPSATTEAVGYDWMIAMMLAQSKRRYWLRVPSLVEHTPGLVSMISPSRSKYRQSTSFTDPELRYFPSDYLPVKEKIA